MRNETQRRVDRLVVARASRSATAPGARRSPRSSAPSSLDDHAAQVLVGEPLRVRPAGIGRCLERGQDVIVEEVRERPVPDVVEQSGHPHRLGDEALGRQRSIVRVVGEGRAQAGVERPRPQPGLVHDAQAVREARVLGGREDPAGALELADPAQALEPRRVEEVLLGDVLVRQPGRGGLGPRQPLGELDVPVDRVADEVDGGERVPPHGWVRGPGRVSRCSMRPHCHAGRSPAPGRHTTGRGACRPA